MPRRGPGGGGLEAAMARIASLRGVQMTVGLQGPDHVASGESPGTSIMLRGAVLEFGTEDGRQPARPVLRTSLAERGKRWARGMAQAVPERRKGGTGAKALRVTGVVAVGDVQQMMDTYPWEPNAESTIEAKTRKGRKNRPTIDTGQTRQSMRASVDLPGRDPEVVG